MVYLSKIIKEGSHQNFKLFIFKVIFRHQKTTKSVYKTLLANNIKATFIIETFCSAEIQILNGLQAFQAYGVLLSQGYSKLLLIVDGYIFKCMFMFCNHIFSQRRRLLFHFTNDFLKTFSELYLFNFLVQKMRSIYKETFNALMKLKVVSCWQYIASCKISMYLSRNFFYSQ